MLGETKRGIGGYGASLPDHIRNAIGGHVQNGGELAGAQPQRRETFFPQDFAGVRTQPTCCFSGSR